MSDQIAGFITKEPNGWVDEFYLLVWPQSKYDIRHCLDNSAVKFLAFGQGFFRHTDLFFKRPGLNGLSYAVGQGFSIQSIFGQVIRCPFLHHFRNQQFVAHPCQQNQRNVIPVHFP